MKKRLDNPWLSDASVGATGETFEIRTLVDFFKVPDARRYVCLREFHAWLAIQEGVTELLCAAGDALSSPVPRDALHWKNDVFCWHDDGKATISVHIETAAAQRDNKR